MGTNQSNDQLLQVLILKWSITFKYKFNLQWLESNDNYDTQVVIVELIGRADELAPWGDVCFRATGPMVLLWVEPVV